MVFCGLLLLPGLTWGAKHGATDSSARESNYIKKMDQYLNLKLSINNDFQEFRIYSNQEIIIKPNVSHAVRFSGHYRILSISGGFSPGFIPGNHDDNTKGDTRTFGLGMNLNFKHWIQGISYGHVKGFYLANTADFDPNWSEGDDYVQFPDLVYNGFQGHTGYQVNPNFSSKALTSQTERQLKGAGSLIAILHYRYYIADNQVTLTGQNSSQKSNNFEMLISLGYYRTFVLGKNFYVSAGLAPAGGIIFTSLLTRQRSVDSTGQYTGPYHNTTVHHNDPIWRLEGSAALGYSSERFFAGVQMMSFWEGYDENSQSHIIVNDRIAYQVFVGYRFKAPGIVVKTADLAEDKKNRLIQWLPWNWGEKSDP